MRHQPPPPPQRPRAAARPTIRSTRCNGIIVRAAQAKGSRLAALASFRSGRRRKSARATVRVAVLDTGLDLTHPEIAASHNIAAGVGHDRQRRSAAATVMASTPMHRTRAIAAARRTENSYHGTHVAGTIGAANTNDRVGVASGAWNVTIVPVRVLGRCGGELADIVSGIRWAAGIAPARGRRRPADQQSQRRPTSSI